MKKIIVYLLIIALLPVSTLAMVVPQNSSLKVYDFVSSDEETRLQYRETDVNFLNERATTDKSEKRIEDAESTGIEHDDIGIVALPSEKPKVTSGFMKIGDIKGESTDDEDVDDITLTLLEAGLLPETDDEVLLTFEHSDFGPGGQLMNKADLIERISGQNDIDGRKRGTVEYTWKIEKGEKAKKPKEIVVVGSKVKEVVKNVSTVEVRGWNPEKKEELLTEDTVMSDNDLTLFMASVATTNNNIKAIAISDTDAKMAFTTTVKLFGLLPVAMLTEVQIDFSKNSQDGRVKVKFPWWRLMATNTPDGTTLKSSLENDTIHHHTRWQDIALKRGMVNGENGESLVDLNPQPDPPSNDSSVALSNSTSIDFSRLKAEVALLLVSIL